MKVEGQRSCLQKMLEGKEEAPDDETLKKDFCMFDVKLDKKRHVISFEKNEKKYNDSLRLLGFVAIVTLGLDLTAPPSSGSLQIERRAGEVLPADEDGDVL